MADVKVIISKWVKLETEILLYNVENDDDAEDFALDQANDPSISKDWEEIDEESAIAESKEWL